MLIFFLQIRFFDYLVGFYGSVLGVVFSIGDNIKFFVGMNCFDIVLSGMNFIWFLVGYDVKDVVECVDGNGYVFEIVRMNGYICIGC